MRDSGLESKQLWLHILYTFFPHTECYIHFPLMLDYISLKFSYTAAEASGCTEMI